MIFINLILQVASLIFQITCPNVTMINGLNCLIGNNVRMHYTFLISESAELCCLYNGDLQLSFFENV